MTYKYIGQGAFQHGIPARDITDAEFAAFTNDQRARVIACGLYKLVGEPVPEEVEAKEHKNDKPRRQSTS